MLHVACTVAVICKSIYRYETGLTAFVFYQEALLFVGKSTTTETWDKNATILGWNINMFAKWHRWKFQSPLLSISGSSSASGSIACFGHIIHKHIYCLQLKWNYMQVHVGCLSDRFWAKSDKCRQLSINLTNSFKWKYTLLHAGMCRLSEWHLPL